MMARTITQKDMISICVMIDESNVTSGCHFDDALMSAATESGYSYANWHLG